MATAMSRMRKFQSRSGIDGLGENARAQPLGQGRQRHQIDRPTEQALQMILQVDEIEQVGTDVGAVVDENVDVTVGACLAARARSEHRYRPDAERVQPRLVGAQALENLVSRRGHRCHLGHRPLNLTRMMI
ncbi:hypothetical protein DF3PA_130116 [Candidatus Defluviicoccus seviourii]|uniref:Uncharacterized protein n=1 Tax=Candidatus Defluviicoccus seviourii TaxID=2565273 RepID=A0A564WCD1_9PROT|nr:hypothetical protein DF3PA_130116 [Candidatus Defluviicoccus seviourii]